MVRGFPVELRRSSRLNKIDDPLLLFLDDLLSRSNQECAVAGIFDFE